ncbi:MAG: hypothetical protein AABY10_04425 [Nanoarchaeota archaeon]
MGVSSVGVEVLSREVETALDRAFQDHREYEQSLDRIEGRFRKMLISGVILFGFSGLSLGILYGSNFGYHYNNVIKLKAERDVNLKVIDSVSFDEGKTYRQEVARLQSEIDKERKRAYNPFISKL